MKKTSVFIFLLCVLTSRNLCSQFILAERVLGMRVEGLQLAKFPVALMNSQPVTISFDVNTQQPEYLRLKIIHCDRNWNPTPSSFVNNESLMSPLTQIPYEEAPAGVGHYRWTYAFQLPGFDRFEQFRFSGNYRVEIWNQYYTELLAFAKIFVAEEENDSALSIERYQLPSEVFPMNQANRISFCYAIPSEKDFNQEYIDRNFLRTVDVYTNRKILQPRRIDVDDTDPFTFVKGWTTSKLIFRVDNILPGNEYRTLDFRSVDFYPPGKTVVSIYGADVPRFFQQGKSDNDGASSIIVGSRFADYEYVQFELISTRTGKNDSVSVVGDFNAWNPSARWAMSYDSTKERYYLTALLRRGQYDYQYVQGKEWYALEGNDWRTMNVYTAFLYYRDPNLGGYDRILLSAQQKGPRQDDNDAK